MSTHWFQNTVDETAGELETDLKSGLSNDAARDRLARYGPNELAETPKASALVIYLRQLKDPLLIIYSKSREIISQAGLDLLDDEQEMEKI